MALDTLKSILPRWVTWKTSSLGLFSSSAYPLPEGIPKFIGSLVQRFNIRKGRAAKPYRENIDEISERISKSLVPEWHQHGMTLTEDEYGPELLEMMYCLGQIPDFQGLLPKSNDAGVPVFELDDNEIRESGPVLEGMVVKREMFKKQFIQIAAEVTRLLNYA